MNDERLRAYGKLATEAAGLEMMMFSVTRAAVGGSYRVYRAIAGGLSFDQLASLLTRVLEARDLLEDDARAWIASCRKVMSQRNGILHAMPDDASERIVSRRSHPGVRTVPTVEVLAVARSANELIAFGAATLMFRFQDAVGTGGA